MDSLLSSLFSLWNWTFEDKGVVLSALLLPARLDLLVVGLRNDRGEVGALTKSSAWSSS